MSNSEEDRIEPSFAPEADVESASAADPSAVESVQGQAQSPEASGAEHLLDPEPVDGESAKPPITDAADAGDPDELSSLRDQVKHEQERYLRAMAEMENVRRRAADDVSKAHKFSIEQFAESLIPVKDSLEMALNVDNPTTESYQEGIEATLKQLTSAFDKNKLTEIDPMGQKFDPNLHQAISMVPASATNPPVEPNHVATVLQKGYLINDRVLRPALVTVVEA